MAYPFYSPYYGNSQLQLNPQQNQYASTGNNNFVSVRNEAEARNYPVAYGNSVTFRDENAPYMYTKTMGFSQLDQPVFERYRLVKEPVQSSEDNHTTSVEYVSRSDFDNLRDVVDTLKQDMDKLKGGYNHGKYDAVSTNVKDGESKSIDTNTGV